MDRIRVIQGDITTLKVDAIVNAANSSLLGGGGVDGAIHRRAGPELLEYCRKLGGCKTGDAKASPGFLLPARFVIHTVGPVWAGSEAREGALLASCHRRAIEIAAELRCIEIAIPAISTGAYGYPVVLAARVAMRAVHETLAAHDLPETVVFCCFSDADRATYQAASDEMAGH